MTRLRLVCDTAALHKSKLSGNRVALRCCRQFRSTHRALPKRRGFRSGLRYFGKQKLSMNFRKDFVLFGAALLVGASVVVSCGRNNPSPNPQSQTSGRTNYQVKGIVKELKVDGRTVVIQHEEVPGYMPAMTMPFKVKNTNELDNLQPEDRVSFRMVVTADEGWIENVIRVGTAKVDTLPSVESFRRVRDVDPLKVGDLMPDYRFTNELGRAVSLKEFKGKALALTFIFTRCPFPSFARGCRTISPRLTRG